MIVKGVKFNGISADTVNGKPIRAIVKRGREYVIKDRSTFELLVEDTTVQPTISVRGITDGTVTVNWGEGVETYEVAANEHKVLQKSTPYAATGTYNAYIKNGDNFELYGEHTGHALFYGIDIIRAELGGIETENGKLMFGYHKKLTDVVLFNIGMIPTSAFSDCSSLVNITIPASVKVMTGSAFAGCKALANVYYEGTIEDWCNISFTNGRSDSPMAYNANFYILNDTGNWYKPTEITIPNTISHLGMYQFSGFAQLTKVWLGTIWWVNTGAFYNCTNLKTIEGYRVYSINKEAFYGCTNLENIDTSRVTVFGDKAFQNCTSLSDINISKAETIGNNAFQGCTNLTEIIIPDSVTSIGNVAFGSTGLTSVVIPDSVTTFGTHVFNKCTSLTSVKIGNGITSIGNSVFSDCTRLTDIEIPTSVTSIGSSAFSNCSKLTSINIPDSVTTIMSYAFYDCKSLKHILVPSRVTSIRNYAFATNSSLKITFTSVTPPTIEEWALGDYFSGTIYVLASALDTYKTAWSTWADEMVGYTDGLIIEGTTITGYTGAATEVVIPEYITAIGDEAFRFSDITSISLPSTLTDIGNRAFLSCTGLTSITLPNGLLHIGDQAFFGCGGISEITIPSSVVTIGEEALDFIGFSGSDNIITFTFESCIPPTIGEEALGSHYDVSEIIVPTGYGEVYKTWSSNWEYYDDKIIERGD